MSEQPRTRQQLYDLVRQKGLFRSFLGYSEAAATILGLIFTEAELEQIELDNQTYYVAKGDRQRNR